TPGEGREALGPGDFRGGVGELLPVPTRPYTELEPAAGQPVEGGHGLREVEDVVLQGQRYARADQQALGGTGRGREADERVHHPEVLRRQVAARRIRGLAGGRDVGMLADPERLEATLLQPAGQLR